MTDAERTMDEASASAPVDALPLRPGSYSAEELAELERRERMSGWLLLFFGGAALATAALAFYLFSDDLDPTDQYQRLDRPEDVAAPASDDTPFVWGVADATSEPESEDEAKGTEQQSLPDRRSQTEAVIEIDSEPQTFDFPGPPTQPSAPTFAGPPAGSVDRETNRALRSGKAQLWREQGQRGYVLVSGVTTYGTRECRQVSYTRFEQGRQATSPSAQWCRIGSGGKWRPDPRGPE